MQNTLNGASSQNKFSLLMDRVSSQFIEIKI